MVAKVKEFPLLDLSEDLVLETSYSTAYPATKKGSVMRFGRGGGGRERR
jgi:hypothetical protein